MVDLGADTHSDLTELEWMHFTQLVSGRDSSELVTCNSAWMVRLTASSMSIQHISLWWEEPISVTCLGAPYFVEFVDSNLLAVLQYNTLKEYRIDVVDLTESFTKGSLCLVSSNSVEAITIPLKMWHWDNNFYVHSYTPGGDQCIVCATTRQRLFVVPSNHDIVYIGHCYIGVHISGETSHIVNDVMALRNATDQIVICDAVTGTRILL
ncbi:hypothetical protein Pelo_410 [Pelomyxa schiedti]|nr:hypothetical protein Pelo_410 [Pelomyxa schiedti]